MESNLIIETIGTITKEETVSTLDYQIIPGTWVLETEEPFPGYHHADPQNQNPKSIFIIMKSYKGREEISRLNQNIARYFSQELDTASSRLTIFNKTYYAIRLRFLENYSMIQEIQKCFLNEGVNFLKRKEVSEKAIIRVKKYFKITCSENEGIYMDKNDCNMAYLTISELLSWKMFEKITFNIKNNWNHEDFDAALGTMYINGGVKDVVRIFSLNLERDKLVKIRDMFLNEIKKVL